MSLSSIRLRGLQAIRVLKYLFPSEYPRGANPAIEAVGVTCLLLAVFLMLWARDWSRAFEVLLLFATLLSARRVLRDDPDAWVYLVLVVVVLWTLWINHLAAAAYPHWTSGRLEGTRDCARLFLFAVAGWWMGGHPRGIVIVVFTAAAGIAATIAAEAAGVPATKWPALDGGAFGFRNSQHTAIVLGPLLLALLAFGWRFCRDGAGRTGVSWQRALAWAVTVAACLYMIRMTGNRQMWLGLVAAGMAGIWLLRHAVRSPRGGHMSNGRPGRAITACFVVFVLIGAGFGADRAWQKFEREWPGISAYFSEETESVELNSATVRLLLWDHALTAATERPLLGYGGNSSAHLIAESDLPQTVRKSFGHPHNSYLQLWTSYGFVAPLLFIAILGGLAIRVLQAWEHSFLATDVAAFLLAWLVFYAVVNMFESYVFYDSGMFLMMVIGGAIYSATLPSRRYLAGLSPRS